MARSWVKLEGLKELWDQHEAYHRQLVQLELEHPQYRENALAPLLQRNKVLEGHTRHLYSIVQCRYYVGDRLSSNEPNPLESDERFDLEMSLKDVLYPALDNFRAEFKTVKDALDDPLGSIKKFKGRLHSAKKNIHTLEKQLESSSKEICGLQKQIDNLEQDSRDVMGTYAEEVDEALPSQQDVFALKNKPAKLEARINHLDSSVEEKGKGVARFLQENNEPYMSQSLQKKSNPIKSTQNATGSDKSKIVDKLSYEEDALFSQLQAAIREKDAMEENWLDACKSEKILREVFVSNEVHREKLVNDLEARNQSITNLNNQLRQARPSITHLAPRPGLPIGSMQNNSMTRSPSTHASIPRSGSVASPSTSSTSRSPMTEVSRTQAIANLPTNPNDPYTPPRQSIRSISMGNSNPSSFGWFSEKRQTSLIDSYIIQTASNPYNNPS